MKIEMDGSTGLCIWGSIVVICLSLTAMRGCATLEKTKQVAMQNGMSEEVFPAQTIRGWVSKQ